MNMEQQQCRKPLINVFSEFCRICLNGNSLKLWKSHEYLLKLFCKVTDIEVDDCDDFQKYVCNTCVQKLKDISEFINVSKYNDITLKHALASADIKEEEMCDGSGFVEDSISTIHSLLSNKDVIIEKIDDNDDSDFYNDIDGNDFSAHCVRQDNIDNETFIELKSRFQREQEDCTKMESVDDNLSLAGNSSDDNSTQQNLIRHSTRSTAVPRTIKPVPTSDSTDKKRRISRRKRYKCIKEQKPDYMKPYKCPFCDKRFSQKGNMQTHTRLHTGEKPFQCSLCPEKFHQLSNLNRHVLHHTSDTFECTVCFNKFRSQELLIQHRAIHKADKLYLCHICSKKFSYQWSLATHLKNHTTETQELSPAKRHVYQCQVCSMEFTGKSDLKCHEQIHSNAEHNCVVCSKSFRHLGHLSKHIKMCFNDAKFQIV